MKPDSISELDRREARIHGARMGQSSCGQQLAGGNETLEMSERVVATPYGGIGLIHRLARQIGLPDLIDDALSLLKLHLPYHESDHVLNIAYNVVCGGKTLDDIERLRNDEAYLRSLGTCRLPDPTTAGDFLRRFRLEDID
ncbi:MAG: IS1380 family transposase, partial [Planctomycetes bacterium]|nr:IS1380 family transposase [Planctomycetota bacterium]